MPPEQLPWLTAAVFVVAFLYSCVGHAGASGYIAAMSLFGLAPEFIKPTALTLNIIVAAVGTWQFRRAGHFSWGLFWPFAALAMPMAFLGGYLNLPTHVFKTLIGVVLLFSAARLLFDPAEKNDAAPPRRAVALPLGGGLGLLAGLTGTGGGIFLTPLLLLMGWARTKQAAAASALFILVNSASGLLGNWSGTRRLPSFAAALAVSVLVGGAAGSYYGSNRFEPKTIKRVLALVLCIAGAKLILTA